MNAKPLTEERANKVYDILVAEAGANPRDSDRADFIYQHCVNEHGCMEYRFQGKLGFGGKYRSSWNGVTYYHETETPEMVEVKTKVDALLKKI